MYSWLYLLFGLETVFGANDRNKLPLVEFLFTFDLQTSAFSVQIQDFLTIIWKQGMCMYMNQIKFHLEEQIHQIKDLLRIKKNHLKSSKCPNLRYVLYAKEKAYYTTQSSNALIQLLCAMCIHQVTAATPLTVADTL